ncbi:MAG: aminotransferase class I/II-fold pyridoxal phosphate-dependent enzyme, partial [Proteobacteria bacterium]
MEFSEFGRFLTQGSGIVQLMDDLGGAGQAGEVSMLGGGNPGAIPAMQTFFRKAMTELLGDGARFDAVIGAYDSPEGDLRFRQALAHLLRDTYGWRIDAGNIAVTNGSQSTFFVLFNLFSGRYADGGRRKVLLPLTPEYIGYADAGLGETIFVANRPSIELKADNLFKYHVDVEGLHVDPGIGAMCVSRPTNPTGNVLTDTEVDILRERCRAAGIPLILDCAYGTPFPNIIFTQARPVWDDGIVLCLSLSKLGLPGVRTGIVVAEPKVI